MNRRKFIQSCFAGSIVVLAGCGDNPSDGPVTKRLELRNPRAVHREDGWKLQIETIVPRAYTISNVTLVAYSGNGELVCEKSLGDVDITAGEQEMICRGFPAIISARSAEDCNNTDIQIRYWVGSEREKTQTVGQTVQMAWDQTIRKCDEELPPQRLLATRTGADIQRSRR